MRYATCHGSAPSRHSRAIFAARGARGATTSRRWAPSRVTHASAARVRRRARRRRARRSGSLSLRATPSSLHERGDAQRRDGATALHLSVGRSRRSRVGDPRARRRPSAVGDPRRLGRRRSGSSKSERQAVRRRVESPARRRSSAETCPLESTPASIRCVTLIKKLTAEQSARSSRGGRRLRQHAHVEGAGHAGLQNLSVRRRGLVPRGCYACLSRRTPTRRALPIHRRRQRLASCRRATCAAGAK